MRGRDRVAVQLMSSRGVTYAHALKLVREAYRLVKEQGLSLAEAMRVVAPPISAPPKDSDVG